MKTKPRLAIFRLSCCSGCEAELLYFQRHADKTLANFDLAYCRMVQDTSLSGDIDLALIEGAVTQAWQIAELKRIRETAAQVIALGTCAVFGGVPTMKSKMPSDQIETLVYQDISRLKELSPTPITAYITVDAMIRGCPPSDNDLSEILSSILIGKKPDLRRYCVCMDCKLKAIPCLLVIKNQPCLGPITNAGCEALCPAHQKPCTGCYGPVEQSNINAFEFELENRGFDDAAVNRLLTRFGDVFAQGQKRKW